MRSPRHHESRTAQLNNGRTLRVVTRMSDSDVTKILFLDNDETAFQFRKCMAKVLGQLPPMELFHAGDATEALHLMEQLRPDVVVIDNEVPEERDLFLDSLPGAHPPVVVQSDTEQKANGNITYIRKSETLEGIHETLIVATAIATRDGASSHKLPI